MTFTDIPPNVDLLYYPDSEPGIRRRRAGRGFSYMAPDGTRIEAQVERERIAKLGVPPAYNDVWISPMIQGHLQATGYDDRARKQYRYHADWTTHHAQMKFDKLIAFSDHLPALRRWIGTRLRGDVGAFETTLAATLALIDRASLRVGNAQYTQENGSYGATTLVSDHVDLDDGHIALAFTAKGGAAVEKNLYAPKLADVLEACQDLPGAEVLTWVADDGGAYAIRSDHINDALHTICGADVTAKTLRTWNGTHAAFLAAQQSGKLTIKALSEAAAERLHNTPTVARNSYIHPAVIELAEIDVASRETMLARLDKIASPQGLRQGEAALAAFLRGD